jgi:cell division protein FtsI (penicillin-binding protein 3)
MAKLADEDKTFVWVKRQLDWDVGQQIVALGIKGIYQRKEYKRQYPEGEARRMVGFTNVEDQGQEGMELAFKELAGKGSRRVIKDRLGRVVEGVGERCRRRWARHAAVHRQQGAVLRLPEAARPVAAQGQGRQRGGAGCADRRGAGPGQLPQLRPDKRQNLTGEQLRNRALTDTFEPGSTMKPITIGWRWSGRVKPRPSSTPRRALTITGSTITDTHNYGALTVEGVIQKSSNVGTTKIAMQMPARDVGDLLRRWASGRSRRSFPGAVSGRCALQDLAPIEQATMSYGYGLSASCSRWRAPTPCSPTTAVIPATMLKTDEPPWACRCSPAHADGAQDAADGRRPRRHRPEGADRGLLGGRQVGHGAQAGGQELCRGQVPRLVHRHGAHRQAAHHRRRDGRRAQQRRDYGGAVAAPVFSEVVQQTLRMMGVQPDMAVKPQIVANPWRSRCDAACTPPPRPWPGCARASPAPADRQPPVRRATASSPGPARPPTARPCGRRAWRAAPRLPGGAEGVRPSPAGADGRAAGLKAATGEIAANGLAIPAA